MEEMRNVMSENTRMNYSSYSVFSNQTEAEIPSSQMALNQETQNDIFYESQIESPCIEDDDKLETMFERYKYLGTELERNLKQMENKNSLLSNALTQCTKECNFMEQQKELQEQTLHGLHQKLEELNLQKINVIEQCVQERDIKLELINREFETVFNNDKYIRDTLSKINEFLDSDRQDFQKLIKSLETEAEMSQKSGQSYIILMRNLLQYYRSQNISVNQEIEDIDEEIEQMIDYFKNSKDAQDNKLKTIEQIEYEASSILEQIEKNKHEIQEYKKMIVDMQLNVESLNSTYYEKQNTSGKLLEEKRHEIETLCNNIISSQNLLIEKELEFNELVQENNNQLAKIENILIEKEKLSQEIKTITDQVTELKYNFDKEKEEFNTLEQLPEELQLLDREENEIIKNLESLQLSIKDKTGLTSELMDEMDTTNKEMNKLIDKFNIDEKTNQQLKEEILTSELELKNATLSYEQILKDVNELKSLENELKQLENEYTLEEQSLAKIDQEIENLIHRQNYNNEEMPKIDEKTKKLTNDIISQKSENSKLKNSYNYVKEFVEYIEDEIIKLREELSDVNIEEMIKELTNVEKNMKLFSSQNSLENPHNQEINRLNEQIEKLKTSTEQYLEKKSETCTRYKTQSELNAVDIEVKRQATVECLNKLSDQVKAAMEYSEELLKYYKITSKKIEEKSGSKFVKVRSCIEKRLFNPISQMAVYLNMTNISLNPPTYEAYRKIFVAFKQIYLQLFFKKDKSIKEIIDIASCTVPKKTFTDKVWTNPSPSDSLVSSTNTIVTP